MKLIRHGPRGGERPGLIDDAGTYRDLTGIAEDFGGRHVSLPVLERLRGLDPETLPKLDAPGRLGACLARVPTYYCFGLNYRQHALEMGLEIPAHPVLFTKASSCLAGPHDALIRPRGATKLDYEVELGVVIGASCFEVSEAEALSHVAGYCICNDVSERDFQFNYGGHWTKGKSAPGFGPVGPWLVTADAVPDPQALTLSLEVNGEVRQQSSTADMIFPVAALIAHLSRFVALQPGDLIATGTPSGVAMGLTPPRYLEPGDVVTARIEGLGKQRQTVTEAG